MLQHKILSLRCCSDKELFEDVVQSVHRNIARSRSSVRYSATFLLFMIVLIYQLANTSFYIVNDLLEISLNC